MQFHLFALGLPAHELARDPASWLLSYWPVHWQQHVVGGHPEKAKAYEYKQCTQNAKNVSSSKMHKTTHAVILPAAAAFLFLPVSFEPQS